MMALRADWRARLIALVLPVAVVGLFGRVYYTPDEPREAALSAAMASQNQHVVPELGGRYFMEKPPLLYWLSAAAVRMAGQSPGAARAPALGFLALSVAALALLAARAAGPTAGFVAGVVAASALLLYQVEIWLATDALLLCAVALALFGVYHGYTAPTAQRRLVGYALMHAGLLLAFFAKNFAGWMVPILALLTLVVWDRRYGELLRRELWLPVPFVVVGIGAWALAVAGLPGGRTALRVFFIDNLLGRAMPLADAGGYAYATAHRNAPGKYLVELPVYLLPWTLLAVAALRKAREATREGSPVRIAYRLGLGAFVPALLLLSVAATARGIYLAPALLGVALLIGLWAAAPERHDRLDRLCLALTVVLVALEALGVTGAAVLGSFAPQWRTPGSELLGFMAALGGVAALSACAFAAMRLQRPGPSGTSFGPAFAALALALACTLSAAAGPLYATLNKLMDLRATATRLGTVIGSRELVLLYPDETTEAMVQLYLPTVPIRARVLPGTPQGLASDVIAAAPEAALLALVPDHRRWDAGTWLAYLGYGNGTLPPAAPGIPEEVPPLRLEQLVVRPGGRAYAVMSILSSAPEAAARDPD